MANDLKTEKKTAVVAMLAEGTHRTACASPAAFVA